jgi:DNA-binding transcriptional ArsR family regulator
MFAVAVQVPPALLEEMPEANVGTISVSEAQTANARNLLLTTPSLSSGFSEFSYKTLKPIEAPLRLVTIAAPRRKPAVNSVGDLVLTEPRALLALATPLRLRIFDQLRRDGPVSVAALSATLDEDETSVRAALEEFAACGLVSKEGSDWGASGSGFIFEIPEDPRGREAGRRLANAALLYHADLQGQWLKDDEPRLPLEWLRAAGVFHSRVALTPQELRELQAGLERLLEPYATREADSTPDDARPVRILGYFLPEAHA